MTARFVTFARNAGGGGKVTRIGSSLLALQATHQTTPMRSKLTQLSKRRCHLLLGTDKGVPGIFALFTRAGQIGRMLRAKRENTDMPNERISGNCAVTLCLHVQLLRRAVPE